MEGRFPVALCQGIIARHLDVRTLCALMQCSQRSFFIWSSNCTWRHQMERVCTAYPELGPLFAAYGASSEAATLYKALNEQAVERNSNKKRKTPWLMPTHGIWFVFNRYLSLGCDMRGFKELCRHATASSDATATPLIGAIVRAHVPHGEQLTNFRIFAYEKGMGQMFKVCGYTELWGNYVELAIHRGRAGVILKLWHQNGQNVEQHKSLYEVDDEEHESNWWFDAWQYFLLGLPFNPYWTQDFERLMIKK